MVVRRGSATGTVASTTVTSESRDVLERDSGEKSTRFAARAILPRSRETRGLREALPQRVVCMYKLYIFREVARAHHAVSIRVRTLTDAFPPFGCCRVSLPSRPRFLFPSPRSGKRPAGYTTRSTPTTAAIPAGASAPLYIARGHVTARTRRPRMRR